MKLSPQSALPLRAASGLSTDWPQIAAQTFVADSPLCANSPTANHRRHGCTAQTRTV